MWDIDKEVLGYFKHIDTIFHSSGCFLLLERAKRLQNKINFKVDPSM